MTGIRTLPEIILIKALVIIPVSFMMAACTMQKQPENQTVTDKGSYYVDSAYPAKGMNDRVRFLIVHYTALDDSASLKTLTKEEVSAHYLVPEHPKWKNNKPVVLQLVPEEKRAWHAGVSNWQGRINLNDSSIGIECVNPGYTLNALTHDKTWYAYNKKQIDALTALAKDIIERYQITPDNVLGHSDIAPSRKSDPGKFFPWEELSTRGIGAWPDAETVHKYLAGRSPGEQGNIAEIQKALSQYGYDKMPQTGKLDKETRETISAFQMHFRPDDISGSDDAQTEAIAKALVEKYRSS